MFLYNLSFTHITSTVFCFVSLTEHYTGVFIYESLIHRYSSKWTDSSGNEAPAKVHSERRRLCMFRRTYFCNHLPLTPLMQAHSRFLAITVWGCQLRYKLSSLAGHICPAAQRHTCMISQSSCCCLFKYDSLTASSSFMLPLCAPLHPPLLPVFEVPPVSSFHQPFSHSRVFSLQQFLTSSSWFSGQQDRRPLITKSPHWVTAPKTLWPDLIITNHLL